MRRRPTRSTRTVTLFPYTTLFRSPEAVLRSFTLEPLTVVAHEVPKAPCRVVPSEVDERGISARQSDRAPSIDLLGFALGCEHQRAGIVIETVAVAPVGNRGARMLKHAAIVAHALDYAEMRLWRSRRLGLQGCEGNPPGCLFPRVMKQRHVSLCDHGPHHVEARLIGIPTQLIAQTPLVEKRHNRIGTRDGRS